MAYSDFVAGLSPTVAKYIKTAEETKIVKLPLASYGLTKALKGGIAKGRITLLYGNESSGKSLLMMQSIGLWQKKGIVCAYIDVEGTYDKTFGARLGVNNEELILVQKRASAQIEDAIKPLIHAKIDVIVIDSISDILPEIFLDKSGEMNGQTDRKQIGAHAKAITALVNGIHYINEETAVVLISQTTTFIGQSYVEQVPHGGKKVLFNSSTIIKLTSSSTENSQIKGNVYVGDLIFEKPIARKVDFLIKKSKLGGAFDKGDWNMYYAGSKVGIDVLAEIVAEAISYKIIIQAKSWFKYNDINYQGEDTIIEFFKQNPEQLELVKKQINAIETGEV